MNHLQLAFPDFQFELISEGQKKLIFDTIRKKFIPLTPEEWVRQHAVQYLLQVKNCKPQHIALERMLTYNRLKKRFDILVFGNQSVPVCLVECKAPDIEIKPSTVLQASVYNKTFNCRWLWITNGKSHFWFEWDGKTLKPAAEPTAF